MTLEGWIDWLSLDGEELLLDKSERAELLELVLELKKFRESQEESYDDFLNDKNFLAPQAHGFNRGLGAEVV